MNDLVSDFKQVFKVYRQVLHWFDVSESYEKFCVGPMPIFIWDMDEQNTKSWHLWTAETQKMYKEKVAPEI